MHPVSGMLFYILVFVFSLISSHPVSLISGFFCALIYDLKLRGKKALTFTVKFILPFILLSSAINGLFNHSGSTVLFSFTENTPFTLEAVLYGLAFSLRAAGTLIWLNSFNEIMTNDRILFLFGRISPKIALLLSMALRFIPLITQQSLTVSQAQKGVGGATASSSFLSRLKNGAKRLSILVSWTLERGIDTSDSMKARGYGLRKRSSYNAYIFSLRDIVFCLILLAGVISFIFRSPTLTAQYIPEIFIPFPDISALISSVFFVFIMLLPFIIDTAEEKKWSALK